MNRTDKHIYFLDLALRCSKQGTCLRRNYGTVIVDKHNTIISTGYTGQPIGQEHCRKCWRQEHNIPSGSNYEKCFSVHAEQNAIIQAGKLARDCDIYIAGFDVATNIELYNINPCFLCAKILMNSNINNVITKNINGVIIESILCVYKRVVSSALNG